MCLFLNGIMLIGIETECWFFTYVGCTLWSFLGSPNGPIYYISLYGITKSIL